MIALQESFNRIKDERERVNAVRIARSALTEQHLEFTRTADPKDAIFNFRVAQELSKAVDLLNVHFPESHDISPTQRESELETEFVIEN